MAEFTVTATAPAELDARKRVRYSLGMLLGAQDFVTDQHHHRERAHAHTRALHGYGTVAGLGVTARDDRTVVVAEGIAVDPAGRTICVPREHCADLETWVAARLEDVRARIDLPGDLEVDVVLSHRECEAELVPLPTEECRSADDSMTPSRVVDAFDLDLRPRTPRRDASAPSAPPSPPAAELADVLGALEDADAAEYLAELRRWTVHDLPDTDTGRDAGACWGPRAGGVRLATVRVRVDTDLDEVVVSDVQVDEATRPVLASTGALEALVVALAARAGGGSGEVEPDAPDAPDTPDPDAPAPDTDRPPDPAPLVGAGAFTLRGEELGPTHGLRLAGADVERGLVDLAVPGYRGLDAERGLVVHATPAFRQPRGALPAVSVAVRLLSEVVRLELSVATPEGQVPWSRADDDLRARVVETLVLMVDVVALGGDGR